MTDRNASSGRTRRAAAMVFALACAGSACSRGPAVLTDSTLPLRRVVVYRNGVGYFEREGHVSGDEVRFRVLQSEVGDFLATLAVMERGGSSVRSAAFPMPDESTEAQPNPTSRDRRVVRLALDGREHDLLVGYTVETPIWRPSYRLVFSNDVAQVQAWGIVQNVSGEDWRNVRLSLVAGAPVSFRSELAQAVIPPRPVVTDRGAVIDAVPQGETTLAQEAQNAPAPPPAVQAPATEASEMGGEDGDVTGYGGLGGSGFGRGGGGVSTRGRATVAANRRAPAPSAPVQQSAPRRPAGAATATPPPPPPTSTPRNLASLAALAVQGGATRYDLPNAVTIPDRSATMVMLASRDVPGAQMYLFAPDQGVGDSNTHPFHVARFENRTGALLERGSIAIFEEGAFLGQGMLEALPDGATTTVPFALERGIVVESTPTWAVEGARLVRVQRESVTIERYNVSRTTWRVRNGLDKAVRVMVRQVLNGAQVHQPPEGTELTNGNALVPVSVQPRNRHEVILTARTPFTQHVDLGNEQAALAIETYLREGNPPEATARALRAALDLRRQMEDLTRERTGIDQRREDLQRNAEETRENLRAIQRNPQAADLRTQLTARLGRVATELDQLTRRIVELDTQIGERRVRLAEAVRGLDVDTSVAPNANTPSTPGTPAPPAAPRP